MILLDTDVCIEILRGNKEVIKRRAEYSDDVAISFMTACELFFGASKSSNPDRNKDLVEEFLLTIEIIDGDLSVAEKFGEIKTQLQQAGTSVADADVLVASTALCRNVSLITGNTRHYGRIEGLNIENWMR